MLTKLALRYLEKRGKSVMINFEIDGGRVQPKKNKVYTINNDFEHVDYRLTDGKPFVIPNGKFYFKKEWGE